MDELLNIEMNTAKVFYKLLVEHKNVSLEEPEPEPEIVVPPPILKKTMRRRSVGAPTRSSKVGSTVDTSKVGPEVKRSKHDKHLSQRVTVRRSEKISRERSATVGARETTTPIQPPERRHHHGDSHTRTTVTTSSKKSIDPPVSVTPVAPIVAPTPTNTVVAPPTTVSVQLAPVTGTRPEKSAKAVVWGISPSLAPEAKKYQVESNKNVTQMLESLRHCFADLGHFDLSAKTTKNGIKVKARRSGKRHGSPLVTVSLFQKEDGETELTLKGGKAAKEQFKELAKKVEETLVV